MKRADFGERQTRQRDVIFDVIQEANGPLMVPEIFERAQRVVPSLGIATVYRTVKLLLEKGLIEAVILPSGETRYELSNLGHHHHFHCRKCEEVYDLDTCPVSVPKGTTYPEGFVVENHEVTLYGVCPECAAAA